MSKTHFATLPNQVWLRNLLPFCTDDSVKQLALVNQAANNMLHHKFVVQDFKNMFPDDYQYLEETNQLDQISEHLMRQTWQRYFGSMDEDNQQLVRALYREDMTTVRTQLLKIRQSNQLLLLAKIKDPVGRSLLFWLRKWQKKHVLAEYEQEVDAAVQKIADGMQHEEDHNMKLRSIWRNLMPRLHKVDDCVAYFPVEALQQADKSLLTMVFDSIIRNNNQSLFEDLLSRLPAEKIDYKELMMTAILLGNISAVEYLLPHTTLVRNHFNNAVKLGDPQIIQKLLHNSDPLSAFDKVVLWDYILVKTTKVHTDVLKEMLQYLKSTNKLNDFRLIEKDILKLIHGNHTALRLLTAYGINIHDHFDKFHDYILKLFQKDGFDVTKYHINKNSEIFSYHCHRELQALYTAIYSIAPQNAIDIFGALNIRTIEQLFEALAKTSAFLKNAKLSKSEVVKHPFRSIKRLHQIKLAAKALKKISQPKLALYLDHPSEHEHYLEMIKQANKVAQHNPITLNFSAITKTVDRDPVQQKYILLKSTFNKRNKVGRIFLATINAIWQEYQQTMQHEVLTDDMNSLSKNVIDAKRSTALNDMRIVKQYYDYLLNKQIVLKPEKLKNELQDLVHRRTKSMTDSKLKTNLNNRMWLTFLIGAPLLLLTIFPLAILGPQIATIATVVTLTVLLFTALAVQGAVLLKNKHHKSAVGAGAAELAKLDPTAPKTQPAPG